MGLIAKSLPPPDKLKGYAPRGDAEPPEGGEPEDDEAAEDDAAGASMMQEFMDTTGMKGDAAEACKALDAYLEARGFVRK